MQLLEDEDADDYRPQVTVELPHSLQRALDTPPPPPPRRDKAPREATNWTSDMLKQTFAVLAAIAALLGQRAALFVGVSSGAGLTYQAIAAASPWAALPLAVFSGFIFVPLVWLSQHRPA